jgi:hypothetical protein
MNDPVDSPSDKPACTKCGSTTYWKWMVPAGNLSAPPESCSSCPDWKESSAPVRKMKVSRAPSGEPLPWSNRDLEAKGYEPNHLGPFREKLKAEREKKAARKAKKRRR